MMNLYYWLPNYPPIRGSVAKSLSDNFMELMLLSHILHKLHRRITDTEKKHHGAIVLLKKQIYDTSESIECIMHSKIYNCEFYKQPVHLSRCLYEIIMQTAIQCEKVINIITALDIYGHEQGIHCAMYCTGKTKQNLFLPRENLQSKTRNIWIHRERNWN